MVRLKLWWILLLLAAAAAAAVFVLLQYPLADRTAPISKPEQSKDEAIRLRIIWWGSQIRHQATLDALNKYEELNPNIKFEFEYSGWEGYWDKLATQVSAKQAPDIIQMDAAYLEDYSQRGILANLSSRVDTADMQKELVESGRYKGGLYGIALGNNAFGMVYNRDVLEKLGVALPSDGWTWKQFFQLGQEAAERLGPNQYALPDLTTKLDLYGMYQLSRGKGYYVTEQGKFNIDRTIWLEWQSRFKRFRENGIVPPASVTVTDQVLNPNQDLLAKGKILIREMHAAQSTAVHYLNPGAFQMVTMPRGEEPSGWLKPSMFWSVNAASPFMEESMDFINWFIHSREAAEILGTSRGIPVSGRILEEMRPGFSEGDLMGADLVHATGQDAQAFHPDPGNWATFRLKDYTEVTEMLLYDLISPEKAFLEIADRAGKYEMSHP